MSDKLSLCGCNCCEKAYLEMHSDNSSASLQSQLSDAIEALKPFAKVGSILRCKGGAGLWKATGGENDGIGIAAEDCFRARIIYEKLKSGE